MSSLDPQYWSWPDDDDEEDDDLAPSVLPGRRAATGDTHSSSSDGSDDLPLAHRMARLGAGDDPLGGAQAATPPLKRPHSALDTFDVPAAKRVSSQQPPAEQAAAHGWAPPDGDQITPPAAQPRPPSRAPPPCHLGAAAPWGRGGPAPGAQPHKAFVGQLRAALRLRSIGEGGLHLEALGKGALRDMLLDVRSRDRPSHRSEEDLRAPLREYGLAELRARLRLHLRVYGKEKGLEGSLGSNVDEMDEDMARDILGDVLVGDTAPAPAPAVS